MTTTMKVIREYLYDLGIDVLDGASDDDVVLYNLEAPDVEYEIHMHLENHGKQIMCFAYPRCPKLSMLSKQTHQKMLVRINEINADSQIGFWAINEWALPRICISIDLTESALTRRQLSRVHAKLSGQIARQAQSLLIELHTGVIASSELTSLPSALLATAFIYPKQAHELAAAMGATSEQAEALYMAARTCPEKRLFEYSPYAFNYSDFDFDTSAA